MCVDNPPPSLLHELGPRPGWALAGAFGPGQAQHNTSRGIMNGEAPELMRSRLQLLLKTLRGLCLKDKGGLAPRMHVCEQVV